MTTKQAAGYDQLGEFIPEFAHLDDDALFGENWNNNDIDLKTHCIIMVVAPMVSGIIDSSLKFYSQSAKTNGVSKEEIVTVIIHVAFYAGWSKDWTVFNPAGGVWNED